VFSTINIISSIKPQTLTLTATS